MLIVYAGFVLLSVSYKWVKFMKKAKILSGVLLLCFSSPLIRKNKTAINIEYMKASIRARVEHPFRIIKRQFGFVKARYKGLLKNDNQLAMLFTLANLFRADQMIRQWERSH